MLLATWVWVCLDGHLEGTVSMFLLGSSPPVALPCFSCSHLKPVLQTCPHFVLLHSALIQINLGLCRQPL